MADDPDEPKLEPNLILYHGAMHDGLPLSALLLGQRIFQLRANQRRGRPETTGAACPSTRSIET